MALTFVGMAILLLGAFCPSFHTNSNVLPTAYSQVWNKTGLEETPIISTESETTLSNETTDKAPEDEITTTTISEIESDYAGLNESYTTTVVLLKEPYNPLPIEEVPNKTQTNAPRKCSIGSTSYEEFNLENTPAKTLQCWIKRHVFANPDRRNGDQLRRIVCENQCAYYSAKITNFQFQTGLKGLIHRARTVQIQPQGHCPKDNIPPTAYNTLWGKLHWLQIELQLQNECGAVYEIVSTWKMPALKFLSFDRPYFSINNQENVRTILKNNSNITNLRINQGISCVHCNIFNGIQLPKLTKADIRWKQEFRHVINQTKTIISNAPALTDFTLSLDLPVTEFIWMSKQLKNLQNAQFGIFLNKSESLGYHLSLSTTIGFEKIENLTLRISIDQDESNIVPITIMDFQYLNPSLKCLTVMTKGAYAMNIASESRQFCTQTHKILQNSQLLKCCRD